jgi:hypothetical protein
MAVRITLKRSSILNKRPNADILDPGELALNTNALSPGLFFETENNSVVKVGPTAVGTAPPTLTPSLGETYYDVINNTLSVGSIDMETASQVWKEVASPYMGGTNGYVVFVAPEFPTATDATENDGQSAPYLTVNRAVIEIAKQSIVRANESDRYQNNRYTIFVQPGTNPVYNDPGLPLEAQPNDTSGKKFSANLETVEQITPDVLTQFNPETGGLLLPRGTSLKGLDLRKTILRPSYVPTYYNWLSNQGTNQPVTDIIKWTGNSYITELTFKDKNPVAYISSFGNYQKSATAVFNCLQSHGFSLNDKVFFSFASGTNQQTVTNTSAILQGFYYVYPLSVRSFLLSYTPITDVEANFVERNQLPANDEGQAYLATAAWEPYTHHRLRCIGDATKAELDTFYVKVQKAFPKYFENKINQGEVINPGETEIVAPTPDVPTLLTNDNSNGSPYCFNLSVRSTYGLCGYEHDAQRVTGFRSALIAQFTVASLQNDPTVYEVYTTIFDQEKQQGVSAWYPLAVATWAAADRATRPDNPYDMTWPEQLVYLAGVPVVNIRYAYRSQTVDNGKTIGLPDLEYDTRHFGFRARNGGYVQGDTGWAIGTAVGFWTMSGSKMSVTNSSSNFGSIAIRTEGFSGIGTLGGSLPQDQGFSFAGIRMPQKLTPYEVNDFSIYSLGATVKSVVTDAAAGLQTMTLGPGFKPITLLPYSLAPNTALWVQNAKVSYRAFFVADGQPTVKFLPNGDCQLRFRSLDSTIPDTTGVSIDNWTAPFIKRFQDPRTISQQAYSLILQNTQPGHRDPQAGNILRLSQSAADNNQALIVRSGTQFDPGSTGGWGRVFQVAYSQTSTDGDAPQFNETLLNRPTASFYYTALASIDNARPWNELTDRSHGTYTTYQNKNWYATCNDQWKGVYYATDTDTREELKLKPYDYDSPYATTSCLENQYVVDTTYQGVYASDPDANLYPEETYFRGSGVIRSNYDFSDFYNEDNGTTNFGLLRHNVQTGINTVTTEDLTPEQTVIDVTSLSQFLALGLPTKDFVVLRLTDANNPDRKEFVQVLRYNELNNSIDVLRGLYGTKQTGAWPTNSVVTWQATANEVLPQDYDLNWAPSKYAMVRFLRVMGYSQENIDQILAPRTTSDRNLYLSQISIQPGGSGYALNTAPWGLEFNLPSTLNCTFHQFHTVGYFDYTRGLPKYLRSDLNTKQYYDFISTTMWGGYFTLFGQNESGQTMLEGDLTQAMTGRPYGSFSSDITDFPRIALDARDDGEQTSYVRLVETGPGLVGGPITDVGSISMLPATAVAIGGVFPGDGLTVNPTGRLDLDRSAVGTVNSVTAGIGLGAPNTGDSVTNRGTLNLLPPTATTIGGVTAGLGVEISISGALGLLPGTAANIGGVKEGTGTSISAAGALSILPPSSDGTTIGGVKAGKGILIAPDGTISVPDGPSGVDLLDPLVFNGATVQFALTSGGKAVVPAANQYTLIAVGGVIQSTPQAYSVSGSTITFTAPPPAGATFYGVVFG